MAKQKNKEQDGSATDTTESGFPVPFTIEEFRNDILHLFFMQMRTIGWMTDADTAWRIVNRPPAEHSLFVPDYNAADVGLTYADISQTIFAQCLERLYQLAYYGILDESIESMADESIYMWISAILSDLAESRVLREWYEGYGAEGGDSTTRCLQVAELANARRILEGQEHFYYFRSKEGDVTDSDSLNVRQLALLAGMEEMSIRAAANPKRANPLPILRKEGQEGRTRFAADAAKAWLQSKGRYVPIKRGWATGDIDLNKRRFAGVEDIYWVITDRRRFLDTAGGKEPGQVNAESKALITKYGYTEFDKTSLSDMDFLRELARSLNFPETLFALRVREGLMKEELAEIEQQLRDLAAQS